MLIAMAIGVSAVVVLTSLGEGARRYVTGEFASLGTNMVIVIPGRSETAGFDPSTMMGETPRDLTLGDAQALTRSYNVRRIAPINVGSTEVSYGSRSRDFSQKSTWIGRHLSLSSVAKYVMSYLEPSVLSGNGCVSVTGVFG
jgi:ABC-type antimicrobial peptide transport system permease subunit